MLARAARRAFCSTLAPASARRSAGQRPPPPQLRRAIVAADAARQVPQRVADARVELRLAVDAGLQDPLRESSARLRADGRRAVEATL
eukprot:8539349-Pyramimonas_sp.AAC.1